MNPERYWRLAFIASGGFADVFKASDSWTGQAVALKQLKDPNPENLRRFRRERDILTKYLDNPFVVNILDSDFERPQPYLVLEYSEVGSLQKYVNNHRDWRRVAQWLYDIARGLAAIHEAGDFVRDIKPSNLLPFIDANGVETVKIADFGLGRSAADSSMTHSPFGTKGYIDPIALQYQHFSCTSDIYSLGVTARELLTGSKSVLNAVPGPPVFQSLIASMTHMDQKHRPSARQIVAQLKCVFQRAVPHGIQEPTGTGLAALLFIGIGVAAAVTIGANANTWDGRTGRYRDSAGRFRSTWLF